MTYDRDRVVKALEGDNFFEIVHCLGAALHKVDELEAKLFVLSNSPKLVADSLTYMQRKSLRRLGRKQSLSASQASDPVIKFLYTYEHYETKKAPEGIPDYFDWEKPVHLDTPKLTYLGKLVLEELEALDTSGDEK